MIDLALRQFYDDGPGEPDCPERECAFRQGFVEEARRIVRDWVDPNADTDPFGEEEFAQKLRWRVRERYTVYGPGEAGRKTRHLGYRPGHEIPAARLRGRHHALAYVTQSWAEVEDFEAFDHLVLPAWLLAVGRWTSGPIHRIACPPRPLDLEGTDIVRLPTPNATDKPRKLQLVRADLIQMRPPDWLLRGTLERDTLALIFGDPGSGKSFVAIDWACRIATQTPWRGHSVQSGSVVYVAGEGQQGFGRRIRAWSEYNGVDLSGIRLFVAPAIAIPNPTELLTLAKAIDETAGRPALIVLDTLARCFGGGDENSTQDMSQFISACDAIRRKYGSTILVVHHTGHSDKSRARGAIALKAALDAEYRLEKADSLILTATKMKDAETPAPLAMELVTVELPSLLDEFGNPITSAAINVLDADTSAIISQAKAAGRGKWQKLGLEILQRLASEGRVSAQAWNAACQTAGMPKSTRYNVLAKFEDQGMVTVEGDWLIPTSELFQSSFSPK